MTLRLIVYKLLLLEATMMPHQQPILDARRAFDTASQSAKRPRQNDKERNHVNQCQRLAVAADPQWCMADNQARREAHATRVFWSTQHLAGLAG